MPTEASTNGGNRPIAERLQEVMRRDGVDEREAAHRLLEEAGLPRSATTAGPDHSPGAANVLPGITCTTPGHCDGQRAGAETARA
jgi:hypothetical protein